MSKNYIISIVVIVVVVAGLAFYGGLKYGQSSFKVGTPPTSNIGPRNFQSGQGSQAGGMTQKNGRAFGGMVTGQIISADSNSLTIKSQDGGSRIVFLSASTTISKIASGTRKDLVIGADVIVNGASNTNNSINAQVIQLRPAAPVQPK